MKITSFVLMLLVLGTLVTGISSATAGPAISVSPPAVTLTSGSSVTYSFRISGLEAGLAGYRMQIRLTNPLAGQITSVTFPDWATGPKASSLPSDNVTVSATDLTQQVEDGASGVTLVSVRVVATGAGTSNVKIQNITMQDDHNGVFTPDLVTARLTTNAGNESALQSNGDTTAPSPQATVQTGTNQTDNQSAMTIMPGQIPTGTPQIDSPATTVPAMVTYFSPPPQETPAPVPFYQRVPRLALYGFGLIAILAAVALLYLGTTRKI